MSKQSYCYIQKNYILKQKIRKGDKKDFYQYKETESLASAAIHRGVVIVKLNQTKLWDGGQCFMISVKFRKLYME